MTDGPSRRDGRIGMRVEIAPSLQQWWRGDRYGVVIGVCKTLHHYRDREGRLSTAYPLQVKLDRSGTTVRVHPNELRFL